MYVCMYVYACVSACLYVCMYESSRPQLVNVVRAVSLGAEARTSVKQELQAKGRSAYQEGGDSNHNG